MAGAGFLKYGHGLPVSELPEGKGLLKTDFCTHPKPALSDSLGLGPRNLNF